jgi:glucose-6-phosphate isomerase
MSSIDLETGKICDGNVMRSEKRLRDMAGAFHDASAWQAMDPEMIVYSVEWQEMVKQGVEGGLFWGSTTIHPGRVGEEYFMTRGHFHAKRDRGEYYTTVKGTGMLILMDEDRRARTEPMSSGSLHYIPGHTAHRTVNTGDSPLIFWACWPSDAGHDYAIIEKESFSIRIFERNGEPCVA